MIVPARLRFLLATVVLWMGAQHAAAQDEARTAGPYVPTPQVIVDRMLQMAQVGQADFVVDLGSGDGRIIRTAAKTYGASGFGVDIDPELVENSNAAARREGIGARAVFYQQDVFKADVRKATVVTLYVLPEMMNLLRPKLLAELSPGTRIVSHDFHFRDWLPDKRVSFDVPEKKELLGFASASIFVWIVPAHVAGRWKLEVSDGKLVAPVVLSLTQAFQNVSGSALVGDRKSAIANTRLEGDSFEFALDAGAQAGVQRYTYRGKVTGDNMAGQVAWGIGATAKRYDWRATRIEAASEPLAR